MISLKLGSLELIIAANTHTHTHTHEEHICRMAPAQIKSPLT